MINYNQNVLNIVESICGKFEDKQLMFDNYNSFVSEINILFDNMNDNINKIPDSYFKKNIVINVKMYHNNINMYLSLSDDESFKAAKRIAGEMKDYLITELNKCVIRVEDYEYKLDNYKKYLEQHEKLEKCYKNKTISCDEYIRSYNNLVSLYMNLIYIYNELNDDNMEKPVELKPVSKDVDNMLLIDMNQENKEYEKMLNFYECDIYPNYMDMLLKYKNGDISQNMYDEFTSKVLHDKGVIDRKYNRLQNHFIEYGKMLANGISDYNVATSEELNDFYAKLNKYNILTLEYKKQLVILEGMDKDDIAKYNEQESLIERLYNDAIIMEKELKNVRSKIYNNTVLTMLNKCKDIIENYLNSAYLSDYDRDEYSEDLEKIKTRIEETKKFKATMAIKTVRKANKNGSKKLQGRKVIGFSKNNMPSSILIYNDEEIEEAMPTYEQDSVGVNFDSEYILKLRDYNELLDAYNEQLHIFYQKEKEFLNDKILYEDEYLPNVYYIVNLYNKIHDIYISVYDLYAQNRQGIIKNLVFTKDIKLEKLRNLEIPSEPRKPYISLMHGYSVEEEKGKNKQVIFEDFKILGGAMILRNKSNIYKTISRKIRSLNEIDTLNSYEMIKQIFEEVILADMPLEEKKILNCKLKYRIKYLKYKKMYVDMMEKEEMERKRLSR